MKKLFILTISCFILLGTNAFAQKTDSLKKKAKTSLTKANKKAKGAIADAQTTAATATTKKVADTKTAVAEKAADTKAAVTEKATSTKTAATKTVTEGVNKSADKAIGKDAKGKTIYLGPKGGQYTLSESGKKVYVKTADKLKVN